MRAMLVALVLAGCASQRPATEVLLVLDADPALRASATSVRIVVTGTVVGGATETALDRTLTPAELDWPITLGIVPRGNDATRGLRVESTLVTDAGGIARLSARTGFVPEETRVLTLLHEACCVDAACAAETESCVSCVCVTNAVDPRALPVHGGDAR